MSYPNINSNDDGPTNDENRRMDSVFSASSTDNHMMTFGGMASRMAKEETAPEYTVQVMPRDSEVSAATSVDPSQFGSFYGNIMDEYSRALDSTRHSTTDEEEDMQEDGIGVERSSNNSRDNVDQNMVSWLGKARGNIAKKMVLTKVDEGPHEETDGTGTGTDTSPRINLSTVDMQSWGGVSSDQPSLDSNVVRDSLSQRMVPNFDVDENKSPQLATLAGQEALIKYHSSANMSGQRTVTSTADITADMTLSDDAMMRYQTDSRNILPSENEYPVRSPDKDGMSPGTALQSDPKYGTPGSAYNDIVKSYGETTTEMESAEDDSLLAEFGLASKVSTAEYREYPPAPSLNDSKADSVASDGGVVVDTSGAKAGDDGGTSESSSSEFSNGGGDSGEDNDSDDSWAEEKPPVSLRDLKIDPVTLPPQPDFKTLDSDYGNVTRQAPVSARPRPNINPDAQTIDASVDKRSMMTDESVKSNFISYAYRPPPPAPPDTKPRPFDVASTDTNITESSAVKPRVTQKIVVLAYGCCWLILAGLLVALVVIFISSQTENTSSSVEAPPPPPLPVESTLSYQPSETPNPSSSESPAIFAPTPLPTTTASRVRAEGITEQILTVTDESVLYVDATPQNQAWQWILYEDSLRVSVDYPGLIQRYVLATLYYATEGESWSKCPGILSGRNNQTRCGDDDESFQFMSGVNECVWYGVVCTRSTLILRSIELASRNIQGSLPPELYHLTYLSKIDFSKNIISGSLSSLSSILPENINEVKLNNNEFFGSIPNNLNKLTNLQIFVINNNKIRGSIPADLNSLNQLETINIENNKITGTLPPSLNALSSLQQFLANNNAITGTIPSQMDSLEQLTTLSLSNNQLTGTIPDDMFPPSLLELDLEGNYLRGTIPFQLPNKSPKLRTLDLSENNLEGTITTGFARLQYLQTFNVESNQLTGTIPHIFPRSLEEFLVGINRLEGKLPLGIDNAPNLAYFAVGGNSLTGAIPTVFGNATQLKYLVLWNNQLTGTIPTEMGLMKSLEVFQAPFNRLTGEVPPELCALTPKPLSTLGMDCGTRDDTTAPTITCECCSTCFVGNE